MSKVYTLFFPQEVQRIAQQLLLRRVGEAAPQRHGGGDAAARGHKGFDVQSPGVADIPEGRKVVVPGELTHAWQTSVVLRQMQVLQTLASGVYGTGETIFFHRKVKVVQHQPHVVIVQHLTEGHALGGGIDEETLEAVQGLDSYFDATVTDGRDCLGEYLGSACGNAPLFFCGKRRGAQGGPLGLAGATQQVDARPVHDREDALHIPCTVLSNLWVIRGHVVLCGKATAEHDLQAALCSVGYDVFCRVALQERFRGQLHAVEAQLCKAVDNRRKVSDAILDAIVGDIVYKRFEGKREGFLTNTRSKIVQRETLNKLAVEIGLDKLIKYSTRSSSHNSYMYGNAFEAFIGAIYLDQGYERCKQFMEQRIINRYIDLDKISRKEVNFKSKLIEWSQKNKMEVSFELIEQFLDHDSNPVFQTEVRIEGLPAGTGTGYSKKESQQNAAQMAIKKVKDQTFMDTVNEAKSQHSKPSEVETESVEPELTESETMEPDTLETEAPEAETTADKVETTVNEVEATETEKE